MKKKNTLLLLILCFTLFSNKLINAQCNIDDWTALKALYEATDGDNWRNNTGWEVVKNPLPPLDCNLENLKGVGLGENGQVDSLNLYNHYGLEGYIPQEIGGLKSLKFLDLGANDLNAGIPPELGNLSNLKVLKLSSCRFTGGIPKQLSNLKSLEILWLHGNKLSGNIPPELGSLENLNHLFLMYNQLSGSIPPELGDLENLIQLNLSENELTQNIPSELGNLNNLQHLYLRDNLLNGSIPPEIGDLVSLTKLLLMRNKLTGNLPTELGNLSNLERLILSENKFSGNIPSEIGSLNKLSDLQLDNNLLTGYIPAEFGNLTALKCLSLFDNKLIGSIPPELGNLNNLTSLALYENQLSGNIPSELGNLNNLTFLGLYNNKLYGDIPTELGELNNLNFLMLQNNQLSGSIPFNLGKLNNLYKLNLSSNELIGNIPPELGNLSSASVLKLSSNRLDGNIPTEIGNIRILQELDLSNNQLSGSLPNEISNLQYIDYLILNNNRLSGNIPDLGGSQGIRGLDLKNNFYICSEIENINFIDWETPYEFDCPDGCPDIDIPILRPKPFYHHTPQTYKHNAEQSFLIDVSSISITLSAPFSQTGDFTYQWYKNENQITDAIDSTLYLNNVQLEDVGDYTLHILSSTCSEGSITYISEPISVSHTDLEGCTDLNACNYNQFATIDDGSCEYLSCDTMINPIKIKTANEVILSDSIIKFDLVIDSLGLDYSADGLTFALDTKGNYNIESIEIINPILSIAEVDVSKLYKNTISINRMNSQRLSSNQPVLSATACIVIDDIPGDVQPCSPFTISGGTELASGHFIDFDNIYIDMPFSDCSYDLDFEPDVYYGPDTSNGPNGENWLPLVVTVNPQNCNTEKFGVAEIKILQEGQSPYSYQLINNRGEVILEETDYTNNLIEIQNLQAGNYQLIISDSYEKETIIYTSIPLIAGFAGNENCNIDCIDHLIVSNKRITGTKYFAKNEIEIKGFIDKNQTVEFGICD